MLEKELYKKYSIDINIFKLIQEAYDEHFERGKNVIGCSRIPFCSRNTIIGKLFFPGEHIGNMKMLHGKIHHEVIEKKEVLYPLVKNICEQLGFDYEKIKIKPELKFRIEIAPNKYMEGHIDVWTNYFVLEIKTTDMELRYWADKIAPFHFIQTNSYLGFSKTKTPDKNKVGLAYLLHVNLRAFRSKIKDINDVNRKYFFPITLIFTKKIFDKTLEKARLIFKMIDKKSFNLAGPEYDWECKVCELKVRKICGR